VAGPGKFPIELVLSPSISHMAVLPSAFCQTMSLLLSPLKSPKQLTLQSVVRTPDDEVGRVVRGLRPKGSWHLSFVISLRR
jgi:hypothetical protein